MAEQYIFTMQNLRKVVPPQREILRGIYLSFFPGAKIGILGLNGAGKSTVLRIMAGLDKEFTGEAFPAEGTRIGYLSQDPQLDPKKTVLDVLEDGLLRVELRVLREIPDACPLGRERLAGELLVEPRHDAEHGRLAGAVEPEDADLGAREARKINAPEDLALRRDHLPEVLHREDVLLGHGGGNVTGRDLTLL